MNHKANEVLDYATPEIAEERWRLFVTGLAIAEVLSFLLLVVMQGGGPIFPFTVLYAPFAVIVELVEGNWVLYFSLFVGGPLLYGFYVLLLALPNRTRNLSIAAGSHLICFAITLWQRAVFSVL